MRAATVQASLRIRAVSPEPSLLAHISSASRGTFRQKARSLAPLDGWACAIKICHDGMLEDTNSVDVAQLILAVFQIPLMKFKVPVLSVTWMNLADVDTCACIGLYCVFLLVYRNTYCIASGPAPCSPNWLSFESLHFVCLQE